MQEKQAINWSSTIEAAQKQLQALRSGNEANVIDNKRIRMVSIDSVSRDPEQPRQKIDPASQEIKDLAESIKKHGFINFITVRQHKEGYVIITGERRFIAAQIAGLEKIPVMVIAQEREELEYALIQIEENIQRKDLTPLEEAEGYERLTIKFKIKQTEIAHMVKKNKGYVSKMLRVAGIPETIKREIRETGVAVTKEVLMLLSGYPEQEQVELWGKIKARPTEAALRAAARKHESGNRGYEEMAPSQIMGALQKILAIKGETSIFDYIAPRKARKLLKDVKSAEREQPEKPSE